MALAEFHKRIPALLSSSPSRNRWNQTHGDAQKYLSRGSLHELDIFSDSVRPPSPMPVLRLASPSLAFARLNTRQPCLALPSLRRGSA